MSLHLLPSERKNPLIIIRYRRFKDFGRCGVAAVTFAAFGPASGILNSGLFDDSDCFFRHATTLSFFPITKMVEASKK